jgi:hypothetical protein
MPSSHFRVDPDLRRDGQPREVACGDAGEAADISPHPFVSGWRKKRFARGNSPPSEWRVHAKERPTKRHGRDAH